MPPCVDSPRCHCIRLDTPPCPFGISRVRVAVLLGQTVAHAEASRLPAPPRSTSALLATVSHPHPPFPAAGPQAPGRAAGAQARSQARAPSARPQRLAQHAAEAEERSDAATLDSGAGGSGSAGCRSRCGERGALPAHRDDRHPPRRRGASLPRVASPPPPGGAVWRIACRGGEGRNWTGQLDWPISSNPESRIFSRKMARRWRRC